MSDLLTDLARVRELMEGATPGPWQVIERTIPWQLQDGRTGQHTQRWIYTGWDHPQAKGPVSVVTLAAGIGTPESGGVQFVSISKEDADAIVALQDLLRTHASGIEAMARDAANLRAFAQEVMEDWHEGDLDGGTRQDLAVKHGVLSVEQRFEPCGEGCGCSEYFTSKDWALGQDCYRPTPLLTGAAIDRAMEGEDG